MSELEKTRELDGARLDDEGRYYVEREGGLRSYGYRTHFAGMWVCYTDGHYCACNESE
jgi:hypothetical protein